MAGDENYQVLKFRGENNSQENLRKMTQSKVTRFFVVVIENGKNATL
jgi:hypothetical protein